jgi:CelD/BcsL family acetyltransferase involved in cellulose biosynthesis
MASPSEPPIAAAPEDASLEVETLQVETIETPAKLAGLEKEWRSLERATQNRLPFRTPEWSEAWWKHFSDDRRTLKDSLFIHVIRTARGEIVAIAPLMKTEKPAFGPWRIRILRFLGPDGYVTEHPGLLCRPEYEVAAYRALLDSLKARGDVWDFMLWSGLRPGSPAADLVATTRRFRWLLRAPNYVLPLAATWEEFRARLPRNVKESLRKGVNSLKREHREYELEVVRAREEIAPALEHFFRLHSARAHLGGTVRHRDFFGSTRAREFLIDVCERLAMRDAARVFLLRVDGAVVAARVGFALERSLYLYYSGFDPAYAKYSVMTTLVSEAIRSAIEEGFVEVNLSFGKDPSKTRWRPAEVSYGEAVQLSPSARAPVAVPVYKVLRAAMKVVGIRQLAERYLWRRR